MMTRIFTILICISILSGCGTQRNSISESERKINDENTWSKIREWLGANAPKIIGNLNPPATAEELASIESTIGIKMPSDWHELYLTHNGINHDSNFGSLFYGLEFLSLDKVASEYESSVDLSAESKFEVKATDASINLSDMNNPRWIALAHDGSGNMIRVDMDPGANGKIGQVIFTDIDSDVVILLANSVNEFLNNFASDLKNGKYHLAEDALADGNEYLACDEEIDVINWSFSPRWKHLDN